MATHAQPSREGMWRLLLVPRFLLLLESECGRVLFPRRNIDYREIILVVAAVDGKC